MMKRSQSLHFQAIKSPSQIGEMVKTTSSMRSILNIRFILCHSRVSQITKPITPKSNKTNWRSIIRCLLLSVRKQMRWSDWASTNLKLSIPKQQTKKYTKDSNYKVAQEYKLRKLKLFIRKHCQVILTLTIKKNLSSIITSRANLIKSHIHEEKH